MQKVSIVKGENRRETVNKSLKLISDEIIGGIGERQVIIKPNFVSSSKQLAASHVNQVRRVLDFLKNFYTRKVLIAEAACGDTEKGFKTIGYPAACPACQRGEGIDQQGIYEVLHVSLRGMYSV